MNGEELVRDGGISLLATLLARCMSIVQRTTTPTDPAAVIVTNIMRTFAGYLTLDITLLRLNFSCGQDKLLYVHDFVTMFWTSFLSWYSEQIRT